MPWIRVVGPRAVAAGFGAALALSAATRTLVAQSPGEVEQPPNTREYGLDAGAVIGLGDQSSIQVNVPAARARVGFFLNNNSRWSVEPAIGLSYTKVEEADGVLFYNLEAGALYHFSPPQQLADLAEANRVRVVYARPFITLSGVTGDEDDGEGGGDNEISAGAGLGVKVPWRAGLAFRLEANLGYGFDNEAFRLGAFAGLSFFTR